MTLSLSASIGLTPDDISVITEVPRLKKSPPHRPENISPHLSHLTSTL